MEEAPENVKESSHSAHANGMNESWLKPIIIMWFNNKICVLNFLFLYHCKGVLLFFCEMCCIHWSYATVFTCLSPSHLSLELTYVPGYMSPLWLVYRLGRPNQFSGPMRADICLFLSHFRLTLGVCPPTCLISSMGPCSKGKIIGKWGLPFTSISGG
jgi:hypothetical protein